MRFAAAAVRLSRRVKRRRRMSTPSTLLDKIWAEHLVHESKEELPLLYIDLHLVHEVTSAQAFAGLRAAGRSVRRPERTFATVDHNVPTDPGRVQITDPTALSQVEA